MKKIILLFSMVCFIIPAFAQYNTASLSGPWITYSGQNGINYIIFDGNGNITQLGANVDSLHPCGLDSVGPTGAIYFQINLLIGMGYGDGQMINDSSANIYDTITAVHAASYTYMYKVLNQGALSGTWTGFVLDSSGMQTRNVTLTVNGSGAITSATGLTGVMGNIYASRDTFAGYMTTTDDSCAFKAIQFAGVLNGDTLNGRADVGPGNSSCQSSGYILLVNHSLGIKNINEGIDFSVYPNPFTDRIDIAINNPGQKIQADLYDLYGRKVLSQSLGSGPNVGLDAGSLGSGLYLLTLTDQDGNTTTKRVLKN